MSLKGSSNAEKIWNFFKEKEFNDYGCAGILGNIYAESALNPINLQNTGNTKLGMTDEEYTDAVDNGTYTKNSFIHDGYGYGLVQHTYHSRKKALYDFVKERGGSIGSLETQLLFIYKELMQDYKSLVTILKTATSISEASNAVLLQYEQPADQSKSVQEKRATYGQTYYDQYATKTDLKYVVNDVVDFIGTVHYISEDSISGSPCKAGVARVTKIAKNSKHPYHLINVAGGESTVYGWVDETNIKGLHKDKITEETNKQTEGITIGYTNSSLVSYTKISPNKTSPRNHTIDTITIHCVAGQCDVETIGDIFAPTERKASSNYGIGFDGKIGMYVEEKDRSWCSSNAANDHRAITIEVASDKTYPYTVKEKAFVSLIELVTDICKRNNIKKLVWSNNKTDRINHKNGCNMTVHCDFDNTDCPGAYLYNKHNYIAEQVNKNLETIIIKPETSPTTKPIESTTKPVTSPTTKPTIKLNFKKGDIVNFAGGKHYISSNATDGTTVKASKAKVTDIYESGKHPYHLRAVNDNGTFINGVYGWVDASTLSAIKITEITAGTKLTLKNVASYTSSVSTTKATTRNGTYYVWSEDVVNNRIRITNNSTNVGKSGQVTCWINYDDAKNAADVSSFATTTFTPYKVKVTASVLNIRKGAGTNYPTNGSIRDKGIYTIIGEENGRGATKWLQLKSGAGYIASDYTKKV